MLTRNEAISIINGLGKSQEPFSFYCDFLGEHWCIEERPHSFKLEINKPSKASFSPSSTFEKQPIQLEQFKVAFDYVVNQINIGNSFLTNLTFETPITTNLSLEEIFEYASAKYKLIVPDQFVVFSPETFVRIYDGYIFSYPMKGTIDATIPNAEHIIMNDLKERAEHVTIVDLIRNDLSQVADQVEVSRFRFIDQLETNDKKLLQVSSEVKGSLSSDWKESLGNILGNLLPAGSISGAPKPETIKIIQTAENYQRGFYTGICGHFDGQSLDTGVMIRFIKKVDGQLFYCSGGGITSSSQLEKEYQEMLDKVYLPLKNMR